MRPAALVCFALIAALTAVALAVRPAWPVDETRYLGVAWGMWVRGDFLLPRLNGELYTDKPPLLFWLMHAGWSAFGVNAWWPRLISPLSALLSLWLTARLARRLFPAGVAPLAPLLLCGSVLFAAWSTFLMFDLLLVCAVQFILLGLLQARQDGGARGWILCALGVGAGLLLKGPVVLVHVAPVMLAVNWWSPGRAPAAGVAWATRLSLALLAGCSLALLWVVPAVAAGGAAYGEELLWGQSASRLMSGSETPHAQPWWFYIPWLPLVLLPWSAWPPVWRALLGARRLSRTSRPTGDAAATAAGTDARLVRGTHGLRFCAAWALPPLLLLSAMASKQEQYLLPELPAFALLGAALLLRRETSHRASAPDATSALRTGVVLPGLSLAACGLGIVAVARAWVPLDDPDLVGTSAPVGLALCLAGLAMAAARPRTLAHAVTLLACFGAALLVALHLAAPPAAFTQRDLRPTAARVAALAREGRPIAYFNRYRGDLDFHGRLASPLQVVRRAELESWFLAHPDGVLVIRGSARGGGPPAPGLQFMEALPSGEVLWQAGSANGAGGADGERIRNPDPR